uniref:Mandelate racemase/muconate lactonizing enzyme N-terminal domain-containing protein n=1 Tax=Anopheles albimanus TaxID=7167 RepID=A0A182FF16_ANOAL
MGKDRCLNITTVTARDIRWPTSLGAHGSDAMVCIRTFFFFSTPVASIAERRIRFVPHRKQHSDPDYSCVYVKIATAEGLEGYGMTFTLGRGTDIVLLAVRALKHLVEGRTTASIFERFGAFWRELTSDSQLRWIGPEKGVTHLAVAAIINALWDLWGKLRGVPVWLLLAEMEPEVGARRMELKEHGKHRKPLPTL